MASPRGATEKRDSMNTTEKYEFTWPGKRKAIQEADKPSRYRLVPCKEESKDWDTTENMYIEGDNLEALRLLQEEYEGKIKMIYIDPPYNTGKKMMYNDNFTIPLREYLKMTGQESSPNPETDGRFHTNWLNMMYPRLKLARNLLKDDGVIFISIDDKELENLKKICNEIFGEDNFVGQWNWFKSQTPPNLSFKIKKNIEYILCYEKIKNNTKFKGLKKTSKSDNGLLNQTNSIKTLIFPKNIVKTKLKDQIIEKGQYGTKNYDIILEEDTEIKNGVFVKDIKLTSKFKWSQHKLYDEIEKGTKISIKTNSLSPSYEKSSYDPEIPTNFIDAKIGNTTENAGKNLNDLFGFKTFDYPKPSRLIKYLLSYFKENDYLVLDFFSGSSTTAHSLFKINAEDKGNRKFILVQIPEETNEKSEAYKQGYKNICEIGKERIRRAGDKIVEESGNKDLDIGFKVFKLEPMGESL